MKTEMSRATVPGLSFDDLEFSLDSSTGQITFDDDVLRLVAYMNDIDWNWLTQDQSRVAALLMSWYEIHRRYGGSINLAAEQVEASEIADGQYVRFGSSTIQ
jgi:hypothetical protein